MKHISKLALAFAIKENLAVLSKENLHGELIETFGEIFI